MNISLSPMDYYFYRRQLYTIQFVFEYLGHIDPSFLQSILDKTAQYVPAISSRLEIKSDTEIMLASGYPIPVEFRTINTEPDPRKTPAADEFLSPITNRQNEPLFKTLVTQTPTRTLIGFSFSHMLGDGASFFQFMKIFCDLAQSKSPEVIPLNTREILTTKIPFPNGLGSDLENDLFAHTGYCLPRPPAPSKVSIDITHISNSTIKHMRGKNAVSSNDIIMATLAKKYHADIPLHNGLFIVRCPVDYRKIYGLPSNYFGNAVRDAVTTFSPEEINHLPIIEVAKKIRTSIQNVNTESISNSLGSLSDLRHRYGIKIFENVGCPGLLVSNFSQFPVSEMNFGLGAPIGFHHASLNPRLALILSTQNGYEVRFKKPIK